jgi:hypothetical protein
MKPAATHCQIEFIFVSTDHLCGPDPAVRIRCVGRVPEQKTRRPWVSTFADQAPGDDRYKSDPKSEFNS